MEETYLDAFEDFLREYPNLPDFIGFYCPFCGEINEYRKDFVAEIFKRQSELAEMNLLHVFQPMCFRCFKTLEQGKVLKRKKGSPIAHFGLVEHLKESVYSKRAPRGYWDVERWQPQEAVK